LRVYVVCSVLNVALNVLLIPTLGILGAAIATNAALLAGNAWLFVLVRKRLGVNAFVLPLAPVRMPSPRKEFGSAQPAAG
jgi:O-antigen/teichoic acid export membrane protein